MFRKVEKASRYGDELHEGTSGLYPLLKLFYTDVLLYHGMG